MMRTPRILTPLIVLLLGACGGDPASEQKRFSPVVVYAAYDTGEYLEGLFADFTSQTKIPVTLRLGESRQLADDVIANRGAPPADVLLASNVADAWRAADEGALRPIAVDKLGTVAEFLRDPDGLWAATRMAAIVIARSPEALQEPPETYADLAKPLYANSVCLSSSLLPVNRSLMAMLISEMGIRPAERVVRGWVRNLAMPVFETEAELSVAVETGRCDYAILPSSLAAGTWTLPNPAYVHIEGAGIARHARYPESAQKLVDWLLSVDVQDRHAQAMKAYPTVTDLLDAALLEGISQKSVGLAGWHDNDAVLLAERAGYR